MSTRHRYREGPGRSPLPSHVFEAVTDLLADMLVADLRAFPDGPADQEATPGPDRAIMPPTSAAPSPREELATEEGTP